MIHPYQIHTYQQRFLDSARAGKTYTTVSYVRREPHERYRKLRSKVIQKRPAKIRILKSRLGLLRYRGRRQSAVCATTDDFASSLSHLFVKPTVWVLDKMNPKVVAEFKRKATSCWGHASYFSILKKKRALKKRPKPKCLDSRALKYGRRVVNLHIRIDDGFLRKRKRIVLIGHQLHDRPSTT